MRSHWGVENGLHWVMDMVFRDDECRIRSAHAPANFATIKHMASNLLRRGKGKHSMRASRHIAGWDEHLSLLTAHHLSNPTQSIALRALPRTAGLTQSTHTPLDLRFTIIVCRSTRWGNRPTHQQEFHTEASQCSRGPVSISDSTSSGTRHASWTSATSSFMSRRQYQGAFFLCGTGVGSRKPLPEMSGDVISISRLWEGTKMSETLIAELLRYCKTRYGIDLNESSGPRALLMAELCMLKAVVEAGRAAMQRWCQRLGDGFVGSRVTHGGVRFRFVGRREKGIHGLFGLITLARAYYAPVAGGGKGWVPLAERVGIGGGVHAGLSVLHGAVLCRAIVRAGGSSNSTRCCDRTRGSWGR